MGVSPSHYFYLVLTDQEITDISVHKVSEGQMHEGWSPTLLACLDLADKSLLTILFLWKKKTSGEWDVPWQGSEEDLELSHLSRWDPYLVGKINIHQLCCFVWGLCLFNEKNSCLFQLLNKKQNLKIWSFFFNKKIAKTKPGNKVTPLKELTVVLSCNNNTLTPQMHWVVQWC